jgi:Tol biopolymer transport system component
MPHISALLRCERTQKGPCEVRLFPKSLCISLVAGASLIGAALAQPAGAELSASARSATAETQNIVFVTHSTNVPCDDPSNTVPCHIAVMNLDGVGSVITAGAANDIDPSWSPDGTKIVFARKPPGGVYNIWVMNANGSGQQQLTFGSRNQRYPSWSPDGTRIAYRGYPNPTGGSQIFVMSASGANQQPIAKTGGGDQPVWSPDSQRVAYTDTGSSGMPADADIYAIDVNNPNAQPQDLTPNSPTTSDRYPSWAPNGTSIAFRRLDSAAPGRELWKLDCTAPDCASVSANPTDLTAVLGPGRAGTWSPDSSALTFVSFRQTPQNPEGDAEIFVGSLTGAFPTTQLTQNTFLDDEPHWANGPVSSSPAPPSTGAPGTASGGASGTTPSGALPNGTQALSLRWHVPRQSLKRRHSFVVMVKCNLGCKVSASATVHVRPGKRARRMPLFKAHRTLKANVQYRLGVRIPNKTLRAIRATLRHHRKVKVVFVLSAHTASGKFTPPVTARLIVRR